MTWQRAIPPKVVVCETLRHNVPDQSSMLPCSGKGHGAGVFLSDMSLVERPVGNGSDSPSQLPGWKILLKSRKGALM